jgi:hypothetical protein
MHKRLLALVLGALTLLCAAWTASATAAPPGVQTGDQSATSEQAAAAASGATQTNPSNTNIDIRVFSPGNNGSVSQTNSASSDADASNSNSTDQSSDQTQGGTGGIQTSTQSADNTQLAGALSVASQYGASNKNLPIRVGSPGYTGSVTQSNSVDSNADATNDNSTKQDADQSQAGKDMCACGAAPAAGVQTSDQSADSDQTALAASSAVQRDASNVNIPIRVGSEGNDGSVKQSNDVSSDADATNDNSTHQSADQSQAGSGAGAGIQTSTQSADNDQKAAAVSSAKQDKPKNVNISVRVFSPGDNGKVTQTNSVSSSAKAKNDNDTTQKADQDQSGGKGGCGCADPTTVQTAKQSADNEQAALAASSAKQEGASNVNLPIRVGSKGDGGSVSQSNSVSSEAEAKNDNDTHQSIDQDASGSKGGHGCGCDSAGIQTAKQKADSDQTAVALSKAEQDFGKSKCGCDAGGNTNAPIRVGSKGDDGRVNQSNDVSSEAESKNDNDTRQTVDQDLEGASGTGIQTAEQKADNDQLAAAASFATQSGASNTNAPIRVGSKGDGGSVSQSNSVSSEAESTNDNDTHQSIDQDPSGSKKDGHDCGCDSTGIQTATQKADSEQAALSLSAAKQEHAKNTNAPVRVGSKGDDGRVTQSNDVSSEAEAKNDNDTKQSVDQDIHGASGTGIQTADQKASNAQLAAAASFAVQNGASNTNKPTRVGSKGDGGSVSQSNSVSSEAESKNDNDTHQSVDQDQSGSKDGHKCGCDSTGIQTATQKADSEQVALSLSAAEQNFGKSECGCHSGGNSNAPVRVGSKGDDGRVKQSNDVSSEAESKNDNDTKQTVDQDLEGASGTGIQTADQKASNAQLAAAASFATQNGASNTNKPIRVGSKGDGGSVSQSNSVSSEAESTNDNDLRQSIDQDPSGSKKDGHECGCDSTGIQVASQDAYNAQAALSLSKAEQEHAKNTNAPVRVGSKGDDGRVTQSNDVSSEAEAKNDNDTKQDIDQDIHGASGTGIQVGYQSAANLQLAGAASAAVQKGASNENAPVRVKSKGDGGSVSQSNDVSSEAESKNDNDTKQELDQDLGGSKGHGCGCDSIGIQVAGQQSKSAQAAFAGSLAVQDFGKSECGCHSGGNSNAPVRVFSKGDDGSVNQRNSADSEAEATNRNDTDQDADQTLSGGSGIGVQVVGQEAKNKQAALALSAAFQFGASNDNSPVRVYSKGDGGNVRQSNSASSDADATNKNDTDQDVEQNIRGSKGCGCDDPINVQVAGQSAKNSQLALAFSTAFQLKPKNANGGSSVWSRGDAGSTRQSNDGSSEAEALNRARAGQGLSQLAS